MLPIPTSKVFRSRGGALWWSFWVIVAAVLTVGFAGSDTPSGNAAAASDASGAPVNESDVANLVAALNPL